MFKGKILNKKKERKKVYLKVMLLAPYNLAWYSEGQISTHFPTWLGIDFCCPSVLFFNESVKERKTHKVWGKMKTVFTWNL